MKFFKILMHPSKWFQGVLVRKVIQKVAKHGAGAFIALLSGSWFINNIQPHLDELGVSVDATAMEAGLIVLIAGVLGGLQNWLKHRWNSEPPVTPPPTR